MSKLEKRLFLLAGMVLGLIVGFCISPVKKGFRLTCGNNNKGTLRIDFGKITKKPSADSKDLSAGQ